MTVEVTVNRRYPYPVETVWAAISTQEGISDWLMRTDNFSAEAGHRFDLACEAHGGVRDLVYCQVLEVDPPHRMLWSWRMAGGEKQGATEVEFRLEKLDAGTELSITHRGHRAYGLIERFRSGWPQKLEELADTLNRTPFTGAVGTASC